MGRKQLADQLFFFFEENTINFKIEFNQSCTPISTKVLKCKWLNIHPSTISNRIQHFHVNGEAAFFIKNANINL